MKLRSLLRDWIPPVLLRHLRRNLPILAAQEIQFTGNYSSWDEASTYASGYASQEILEKTRDALLKVKRGEAACERDSVTFDTVQYSYPLLANLLHIASCNGNRLAVLDFGGALGSSYYQNRGYLSHLQQLAWTVVEQPHVVACGREYFANGILSFHHSIDEAMAGMQPHVILLSSVLQYLPAPLDVAGVLASRNVRDIIIDRAPLLEDAPSRLTVQHVPPSIYEASYPCWIFNENEFVAAFKGYRMIDAFDAHVDTTIPLGDATARYRGFRLTKVMI